MNPDANGAVVINMGGHHPEDGMVEGGTVDAITFTPVYYY